MSDILADRMREASVVLTGEELAAIRATIDDVASATLTRANLLDLVRLAFKRDVEQAARERLAELFSRDGLVIGRRSGQLVATLAGITLSERFARPVEHRSNRRLAVDSLAATAILVLTDQDNVAVLPDLRGYAEFWWAWASEFVRGGGLGPTRPSLPPELASDTPPQEVADDVSALRRYAADLDQWLPRASASAKLAALDEQLGLLWWLQSAPGSNDPIKAVVTVCDELTALCRFTPGPPAAHELLARRLGRMAEAPVDLRELAVAASRAVPDPVAEFCALARGSTPRQSASALAVEAADRLYHELQLLEMARVAESPAASESPDPKPEPGAETASTVDGS